ncbi:uncharacterized protein KY384_009060 [Bacidia gigantensis]|uniref:uncharacterized protein n=1 Tax=Bacidia gigantensis TaxID=2732470 RepID=UPI001D03CABC|nr:uncharacterized protein KY384_009060 [Bacidia gigantensis]KAG8525416.1 hypothetical protein KY384_009060 [Bacidia gigantensis]
MVGFADCFWSGDYAGGMGVLFGKLQQGVIENQQVLTIARMRAEAEETYARRLADTVPATDRMTGGFAKDDGASVRKAYEGVRGEMEAAAKSHKNIASNISELVVVPFSRWCEAHEGRVQGSQDDLQARLKAHDKQADHARKLRSAYFNKCRQLEDLEEENKLGFQDPEKESSSPKTAQTPTIKLSEAQDEEAEEPLEIGDETFDPQQIKKILTHMLNTISLGETKVPILGIYHNVSTGADIADYIQKHMNAASISYAERIGQDLITHGFLRLVGNVGSTFANSSRMKYQWRPKVFKMTGIPERKKPLDRVSSVGSVAGSADSPIVGSVGEILTTTLNSQWNPLNNQYPNETPGDRLRRESKETDEKYKASVRRLDDLRCQLEEKMIDHFKFMERCELDRLRAIKAVILDFSGAISNSIPSLQSTVDNMMLYQETIQPEGDLRYLLENYRTGAFVPKVQVYDNYYNHVDEQTFGVDLEARARADRKRVPTIITTILTFLDQHYPDLEGDEARRGIWLVNVPLAATHHLRSVINTRSSIQRDVLERYEVPIVASVLKLYLLELPDSLVSSQVYEIIKTIYSSPDSSNSPETRVSVLQNTLGQLRLANIATLDAITTHFTRLIELTSAGEDFVSALATDLAQCILRPRTETSLTMHEKHAYRLIRDLFDHKEAIFGELKRASALSHTPSGGNASKASRIRAISTDESSRRANMEERNRAIASKSRNSSPVPHANGARGSHRRDRSVDPPGTRFPIHTSPPGMDKGRGHVRASLEVPPENGSPLTTKTSSTIPEYDSPPVASNTPPTTSHSANKDSALYARPDEPNGALAEKSDPQARSSRFPPRKTGGHGSLGSNRMSGGTNPRDSLVSESGDYRGVQLTDKPMDD